MNDQQFALEIRRALDESTGRLPYKVTHRLQQARLAALSRMPAAQAVPQVRYALAAAGRSMAGDPDAFPWWKRAAITILPLLIVAAGLIAISVWNDTELADETAAIDAEVLTDDVPISAYTDRGFGVFLKNSNQ